MTRRFNRDAGPPVRVLVTGSRGKSSIVRLLHAALTDAGLQAWARISGVVPRQLGPGGSRVVRRSAGAHVGEMRWWLRTLPASAQAIVLENSAIAPEFQHLAGRWLRPRLTVLTNALPDHQEAWGPTRASAAEALAMGIPKRGVVLLSRQAAADGHLRELLDRRGCETVFAAPAPGAGSAYRADNLGLALASMQHLGLATPRTMQVMQGLPRDRYDFHVLRHNGAQLAMAFSANDPASTRLLFESLGWPVGQTRLVYNHRADRPARLRGYRDWLGLPWREVLIIGDRPRRRPGAARYVKMTGPGPLLALLQPGERVFGCGNIAGAPLELAADPA
jgi:UDP-N-acetylmuramyl pentapeptide synthase